MKFTRYYLPVLLGLIAFGCSEVTEEPGFISPDIYLKGADTIVIPIGSKGSTDIAWLDGSSMPVEFSIVNVRDENGNKADAFFEEYLYRTWVQPYNNRTDTTLALINEK